MFDRILPPDFVTGLRRSARRPLTGSPRRLVAAVLAGVALLATPAQVVAECQMPGAMGAHGAAHGAAHGTAHGTAQGEVPGEEHDHDAHDHDAHDHDAHDHDAHDHDAHDHDAHDHDAHDDVVNPDGHRAPSPCPELAHCVAVALPSRAEQVAGPSIPWVEPHALAAIAPVAPTRSVEPPPPKA